MKHSPEQINAIQAVAKRCLDELRKCNHKDLDSMKLVIDKHFKQVEPMGFIKAELQVEIGYLSGSLTDRRNM